MSYKVFPSTTDIYARVLNAPERFLIEQGGTGSGKTYGILQALIHIVCNRKRFPATGQNDVITIVGQDLPNLKRDAIRQFLQILLSNELARTLLITPKKPTTNNTHYKFATGWEIEFVSYETAQDAQAGKRRFLYVNEGVGVPFSIYEQLAMRTSDKIIIDFNPTMRFWAHNNYMNPDLTAKQNVNFSVTTYKDNPFMPEAIRLELEKMKTENPQKYKIFGEGLLGEISGQIWKRFEGAESIPQKAEYKRHCYGLDFGFANDVTAFCSVGLLNGKLYIKELIYENGLGIEDLEKRLRIIGVQRHDVIIADSSEALTIDYLRKRGFNIKASKKGAGSIVSGLEQLNSIDKVITFDSLNVWHEVDNYVWKTQKTDGREINVPIDKFNHITDAIRYAYVDGIQTSGRATATV